MKRSLIYILVMCNVALAANIYVDNTLVSDCTSGNYSIANRDGSGSDGNAYNTAQEASDVSSPGDTIYFRAGTYKTATSAAYPVLHVLISGTEGSPIIYRNYGNEEVIVSGVNASDVAYKYNAISLGTKPSDQQEASGQGVSNIIVHGLIVVGSTRAGLGVYGPASLAGGTANPTENIYVHHVIARNNAMAGIHMIGKTVNVTIEYCEAYNNIYTGIDLDMVSKPYLTPQPEDDTDAAQYCTVKNCLSYNNINPSNPDDTDGITFNFAYRCIMEDNIAFGNSDDGMDIYASIECTARNNISFNHNYEGGNGCGFKGAAGSGGRHTYYGNVAFNNNGYSFEFSRPGSFYRTYYPSRIVGNTGYNGSIGISLGYSYTPYDGYEKVYIRNNLMLSNTSHDIYGQTAGEEDSDYNYFSSATDLTSMRNMSQDAHSLSGLPSGLKNPTIIVSTEFGEGWTIEQKLTYIRAQVYPAFTPQPGSKVIDVGTLLTTYYASAPRLSETGKLTWYGDYPDMGFRDYSQAKKIFILRGVQ